MGTTWIAPRMGQVRDKYMLSLPTSHQALVVHCHRPFLCCKRLPLEGGCLLPLSWAGTSSHSSLLLSQTHGSQWTQQGLVEAELEGVQRPLPQVVAAPYRPPARLTAVSLPHRPPRIGGGSKEPVVAAQTRSACIG